MNTNKKMMNRNSFVNMLYFILHPFNRVSMYFERFLFPSGDVANRFVYQKVTERKGAHPYPTVNDI